MPPRCDHRGGSFFSRNKMIEARDLSKRYADVWAVKGISFSVEKGEIVGFLGPNGAGKSTTMKILTCFIPPTGGSATIAGHSIFDEPIEVKRAIGYMPENVPLYPEMRVYEYLHFRGRIKGLARGERKKRVEYVGERCGITEVKRKPISHLSKGYRQRVGLADALLHDPPILILDEPTIGLDPNQIREVRQLVKELGQEHTVILSTHILPEVEMVCERFIIIHEGRIVAGDTIENLRRRSRIRIVFASVEDGRKLEEELRKVRGVKGVTREGTRFLIDASRDSDVEKELFSFACNKGLIMTELRRDTETLENVFVRATMGEEGEKQYRN